MNFICSIRHLPCSCFSCFSSSYSSCFSCSIVITDSVIGAFLIITVGLACFIVAGVYSVIASFADLDLASWLVAKGLKLQSFVGSIGYLEMIFFVDRSSSLKT